MAGFRPRHHSLALGELAGRDRAARRRAALQTAGLSALGAATSFCSFTTSPPAQAAPLPVQPVDEAPPSVPVSHSEFQAALASLAPSAGSLASIKQLLAETAWACVRDSGAWVVPSNSYPEFLFCRDSFWLAATLRNPSLSKAILDQLRGDQAGNPDGHIATALQHDGAKPPPRDRDDESTLLYVLHNYLAYKLGVTISRESLQRAYQYIAGHVADGRYVTTGETRTGPLFSGSAELGTRHYWADTYRPAGRPEAVPAVVAYNQGLYCLALRCLEAMGIRQSAEDRFLAGVAYARLRNVRDGRSLPQIEGSSAVDVSALAPEALSLYLFDAPMLSGAVVDATVERLAKARYADGSFLGFKVLSDVTGAYRPDAEFSGSPEDSPGNYHNGGSWLLYDALALYAAARHDVAGCVDLFSQRLLSEVRDSRASHEFISTNPRTLGLSQPRRDGYGWNAFVMSLLP